jgi:hypothetical protein
MKRFGIRHLLLALPVLALLIVVGCGPSTPSKDEGGGSGEPKTSSGEKKELASTGWGTLTGKVTLVGDAPDLTEATKKLKSDMDMQKDKETCLSPDAGKEEKNPESWVINDVGGEKRVKNVLVWLKAPEGTFFKLPDGALAKAEKETVKLNQPHCAFIPHALVLWPKYIDPKTKKEKPTGQEFVVTNHTKPGIAHNTKWAGSSKNAGNETINAGQEKKIELVPDTKPVTIACNIHGWMNAYAGVFDHPYAAVTDDKGEYTIENVPTGVDLQVVAWHEVGGYLTKGKAKGDTHKLDQKTSINFEVSAK